MNRLLATMAVAACGVVLAGTTVAADAPAGNNKVLVATSFRTSKLVGLNVRNAQGEKLGKIEDFVVNVENGKVAYAALSYGGVLGLGDKLFAIPWQSMKFDHGKDEMFFVVNMSKEKLKAAPGFDKNDWPNFADPHWAEQIDKYYQDAQINVTTKRVTEE